ncbi:MAG: hypothetical protein KAS62_04195, partial [Candidatus Delongbacteria bacterium]|nr:hypothetical protein [Candidatus Delongbacteria bacterium]
LEKLLIESNSNGNNDILSCYEALKEAYKNVNRINIEYNDLIRKTYAEVTRVTDKRLNFLYIDDEVDEVLTVNSEILANYLKSQEKEFRQSIKENIEKKYELKKKSEEDGDEAKIKQYHDEWLKAKGRTIDNVYSDEISRLLGIVNSFLKRPGAYDIKDEFILKVRDNTSDLEPYFSNILKIKFYNDLVSKSKKYFRFEVEKGFRGYRANVMIFTFLFFILFFYVFLTVKKKKDTIYIRRIPGLDALDDAIGRATEMGRPIVYDSGIGFFINPQTIASMLILRSVAKKVAEFKAEIIFPAFDPIVLQVAEEMIASGFLDAGYPEDHKKDNCFFMVQDQFAFAAGLSGLIARKKPATALHFGSYAAESLLIAEAGFAAGA